MPPRTTRRLARVIVIVLVVSGLIALLAVTAQALVSNPPTY
jgi:hypothetical protein